MKLTAVFALCLLLPLASAVTIENQTILHEAINETARIQLEQDTIASQWSINENLEGIEVDTLQTFNSTFTNLNKTVTTFMIFYNLDSVTVFYSNGTQASHTGTDFDLNVTIPANGSITLQSDVPPVAPTSSIVIKPDFENTVPHIILGKRLIFSWILSILSSAY